jgi:glycosyltransferase involved in cell wall biosynthesis
MVEGGHMVIARSLVQALRDAGHSADTIVTPQNPFGRQASAYLATWLTDVATTDGRPIDQVISLRYPSYAVRHPKHVCWLNHTMREYYDLWERFSAGLSVAGRLKEGARRRAMHAADRYLLTRNVNKLFVQSRTIQRRLAMWPELRSTVLYPPPPQREYRCDEYGDYVFMVSRLTRLKRADLLIAALAQPGLSTTRAVIAGEGEERGPLQQLAEARGVSNRVTFAGRISDAELVAHLARCRIVCFPPFEEDYGFVTAEAFASGKGVITCADSGGPAELVQDDVNGAVCEPTPEAIASSLRRVMHDRAVAERMGAAGFASAARLSWDDAVAQLTS